ncbi:hypothetical protein PCANC_12584 [Puccinia coronata f. sp. avenae]|uniref:Uncharacterized protein n=1 Tax=Puccinia coronata f. sp. avenae TaxID=200324 RepID=A0A2N5UN16_9BASI|nr:hypothetical protein PCANC_12584 [Puccinia coronata f. sp. avenae]
MQEEEQPMSADEVPTENAEDILSTTPLRRSGRIRHPPLRYQSSPAPATPSKPAGQGGKNASTEAPTNQSVATPSKPGGKGQKPTKALDEQPEIPTPSKPAGKGRKGVKAKAPANKTAIATPSKPAGRGRKSATTLKVKAELQANTNLEASDNDPRAQAVKVTESDLQPGKATDHFKAHGSDIGSDSTVPAASFSRADSAHLHLLAEQQLRLSPVNEKPTDAAVKDGACNPNDKEPEAIEAKSGTATDTSPQARPAINHFNVDCSNGGYHDRNRKAARDATSSNSEVDMLSSPPSRSISVHLDNEAHQNVIQPEISLSLNESKHGGDTSGSKHDSNTSGVPAHFSSEVRTDELSHALKETLFEA